MFVTAIICNGERPPVYQKLLLGTRFPHGLAADGEEWS